jgi:hypothetical protein
VIAILMAGAITGYAMIYSGIGSMRGTPISTAEALGLAKLTKPTGGFPKVKSPPGGATGHARVGRAN